MQKSLIHAPESNNTILKFSGKLESTVGIVYEPSLGVVYARIWKSYHQAEGA